MKRLRSLVVIGTRPEAIKLAPVVRELRDRPGCEPIVCLSGQHREMVEPLVDYFDLRPDVRLDVLRSGQAPAALLARLVEGLHQVVEHRSPACLVAQGDTTTTLAAALVAFYDRVPLVHVEAGLRTGDLQSPWPEEFDRRVATLASRLHCAPTPETADNLRQELIADADIRVTGNPVVDALLWTVERETARDPQWRGKYARLGDRKVVLVTTHRRENFGAGLDRICVALASLAIRFPDVQFVFPVHLNPQVRLQVRAVLDKRANVQLLEPLPYPEFVWLMQRCQVIVSDSGGIQEEAPSLGKPLLVVRENTERPEALRCPTIRLVGTDVTRITAEVAAWLDSPTAVRQPNPFGDGHAASRIADFMWERLAGEQRSCP